jgi:hypothetical protein
MKRSLAEDDKKNEREKRGEGEGWMDVSVVFF